MRQSLWSGADGEVMDDDVCLSVFFVPTRWLSAKGDGCVCYVGWARHFWSVEMSIRVRWQVGGVLSCTMHGARHWLRGSSPVQRPASLLEAVLLTSLLASLGVPWGYGQGLAPAIACC